jgi:hypothetical protein
MLVPRSHQGRWRGCAVPLEARGKAGLGVGGYVRRPGGVY